jgi:hypothetical protein
MAIQRYWINQPSTLQPYHHLHGRLVLADLHKDNYPGAVCYFTKGPELWKEIDKSALSDDWPNHLMEREDN